MKKPTSSFQRTIKRPNGERWTRVHVNDDPNSPVYFEGPPHWYDGSATESWYKPSWYKTGAYLRYLRHIKRYGEHPEVKKQRLACYKTDDAEPFIP